MALKIFAGIVAVLLVGAFLVPPVIKLQDFALTGVILVGFVMMLVDLLQSLKSRDD